MKGTSSVLALILLAATTFAQILGGSITGTVKDEQGGVLPGVVVTLQGIDATRTFTSNETGEFRFYKPGGGAVQADVSLQGLHEVGPRGRDCRGRKKCRSADDHESRGSIRECQRYGSQSHRGHEAGRNRHELYIDRTREDSNVPRSIRAGAVRSWCACGSGEHRRQRDWAAVELRGEGDTSARCCVDVGWRGC